jgi:hypothetical protein
MRNIKLLIAISIFVQMSCAVAQAQDTNSLNDKKVQEEKNIVQNTTFHEQINRLNVRTDAAKKDLEIARLRDIKEEGHAQAKLWALLTVTISLVSFVIIYVIIRSQKKRREKVEAEKKIKEHELQETKTRLHHNVKLIDGFTQRILEKNKVISELEKKIRSNPLFNQSAEAARKNLEAISEIRILTYEDWEKFQSNVNKVYHGLINRICDSFPHITDAELRMFLLIKLSVKNKDISEILGISPDSVRKTRFRLKKKLNLREEDDLDDFIQEYNNSNNILPHEKLT